MVDGEPVRSHFSLGGKPMKVFYSYQIRGDVSDEVAEVCMSRGWIEPVELSEVGAIEAGIEAQKKELEARKELARIAIEEASLVLKDAAGFTEIVHGESEDMDEDEDED